MRQAIEEGFILDVVKNYTTYATYYRLVKAIEDNPNLPKKKAARALAKFMSLHPHNIEAEDRGDGLSTSGRRRAGISAATPKRWSSPRRASMPYATCRRLSATSRTTTSPTCARSSPSVGP